MAPMKANAVTFIMVSPRSPVSIGFLLQGTQETDNDQARDENKGQSTKGNETPDGVNRAGRHHGGTKYAKNNSPENPNAHARVGVTPT